MSANPILTFRNDSLIIKTQNSKYHSALSIYKVEGNVDIKTKAISISAFEAVNEPYKDYFVVDLKEYNINDIDEYSVTWLNPDGTIVPLVLGEIR